MITPNDTTTPHPNLWIRAIEFRRGFGGGRRMRGHHGFGHGHRHPAMMRGAVDRPVAHEHAAGTTTAS